MKNETKNNNLKLKEMRLKKGFTQKQLADFMGVSQRDISRWETHKVTPRINTLCILCIALDCTYYDLINFNA